MDGQRQMTTNHRSVDRVLREFVTHNGIVRVGGNTANHVRRVNVLDRDSNFRVSGREIPEDTTTAPSMVMVSEEEKRGESGHTAKKRKKKKRTKEGERASPGGDSKPNWL